MNARRSLAALAIALVCGAAAAPSPESGAVSPDRVDDASLGVDGFAEAGEFAWRAFIALNWPAASRGEPDRRSALSDPGPRVWETFKSAAETFPVGADGHRQRGAAWGADDGPSPCGVSNGARTIAEFKPFAEFNQPSFSADSPANPLIAQNGEYVRYEARFNAATFETFVGAGWSEGRNLPDAARPAHFPVGSIVVKAAWRPLNAADLPAVRTRYYVTRAAIVDVPQSLAAHHLVCSQRDVALVGLHIVIKTASKPQWIWTSFEHVDNVPPAGDGAAREPDARAAQAPYGFFDPSRPSKLWPPYGDVATQPIDSDHPPELHPAAMQIVRRHPINAAFMAANRGYWAKAGVKGSVWAHYMLVAAQWPTSSKPPSPENDGAYFPGQPEGAGPDSYKSVAPVQENLVNSTMESYLQEAPSSCMACHQTTSNQSGYDFVGALARIR